MSYDFFSKSWLDKYSSNLNILKSDLELILNEDFEIYTIIDYYDIYDYCFNFMQQIDVYSGFLNNSPSIKNHVRDQISRSVMFFLLDNIYKKPNILLTPYMLEARDFTAFLQHDMRRMISKEMQDNLANLSQDYINLIKEAELNDDYKELINFMSNNSPGLIYYYSRGFTNGAKMFFHLLKNYFTIDIESLADIQINEALISPTSDMNHEQLRKFSEIKQLVEKNRYPLSLSSKRDLQNERDAEAIYTTINLNKIYNDSKKVFIFISSAPNLIKAMKKSGPNITIGNKKIPLFRNIDFFVTALLAMESYLSYSNTKVSLSQINLSELHYSISRDISKIDNYPVDDFGDIDGIVLEEMENNRLDTVARLNELMNNTDLAIILDEFLPEADSHRNIIGGCERSNKRINLNAILYGNDLINDVKLIRHSFENKTLIQGLLKRNMQFEEIQIEYILENINAISCYEKMQVMLFTLPFRLNINDYIAKTIVDKIIKENVRGKIELTEHHKNEISRITVFNIYSLLHKLYSRADDLVGNEKYILWQLVFLYIGRNDLVDQIYDLFSNLGSDEEKAEFSYLYAINFIRKMRKLNISESEGYLHIVNICDKYCEHYIGATENSTDLTNPLIEMEYKKNYMFSSRDMTRFYLNENELALFDDKSDSSKIYVIKKTKNILELKYIDMRFVHLRSIIFNRYLHDFGCLNYGNLLTSKRKLETIYIPLAKNLDKMYYVAIMADYAYLLSLDISNPKYSESLLHAKDIMIDLKNFSLSENDIFWDYVRNYIFGYIYYKLSDCCKDKLRIDESKKARFYFEEALSQIPNQAKYLIEVVSKLKGECTDKTIK